MDVHSTDSIVAVDSEGSLWLSPRSSVNEEDDVTNRVEGFKDRQRGVPLIAMLRTIEVVRVFSSELIKLLLRPHSLPVTKAANRVNAGVTEVKDGPETSVTLETEDGRMTEDGVLTGTGKISVDSLFFIVSFLSIIDILSIRME